MARKKKRDEPLMTTANDDYMDCDDQSICSLDERQGCRSLLCDANGIIIAEMVYRCMICYSIHDFIGDVSKHYHTVHMNEDEEQEEDIKDEEDSNCNNNYLNDYSNNCDESWELETKYSYNNNNNSYKSSHSISNHHKVANTSSASCTRSGYITCPVCSTIRCYTTLQRRYGQFTCVACYRFFKEFFLNPIKYYCPYLGTCALDVKSKCKACWILACIKVYTVDGRRKSILEANTPVKGTSEAITMTKASSTKSSPHYANENSKPKSMKAVNSSCNDDCFNSQLYKDLEYQEEEKPLPHRNGSSIEENENEIKKEENGVNETVSNGYEQNTTQTVSNNKTSGKKMERRSKARVKSWCCLKCANCLADDCGKCINCLDRPKFGGKFVRKQRCVNKKCLEKIPADCK